MSRAHASTTNVSKPYIFDTDTACEGAVLQIANSSQLFFACFYIKLICFAKFCCCSQHDSKHESNSCTFLELHRRLE